MYEVFEVGEPSVTSHRDWWTLIATEPTIQDAMRAGEQHLAKLGGARPGARKSWRLQRAAGKYYPYGPPVVPPVSQVTYAELDVKKDSTHQIVVRRA
jgi:hypothetical protein